MVMLSYQWLLMNKSFSSFEILGLSWMKMREGAQVCGGKRERVCGGFVS